MKKITLGSLLLCILVLGCQKNTTDVEATSDAAVITNRSCAANEVLQAHLAADPSLRTRMNQVEVFTRNAIATGEFSKRIVSGGIQIPVVVNVLYKNAAENISDAQIQSQIDVLNRDYTNTNTDKTLIPSVFTSVDGTVNITFVLSKIIRKATNKKSWVPNDQMKKSSFGGIDPTDVSHYLNMWCCNLGQSLLGYSSFPGEDPAIDGVVILYSAFGSRALYPAGTYISKYDLGRTASHEIGHWMNLYHIWGDDGGSCSGSDLVDDTPNQGAENYNCPVFPHVSCNNNGDMSMNYMDYTADACMYMFTKGQASRMQSVFAAGGPRSAMGQ
ncbi:MAG: zinc metalloprotease [Ginsengibacter sp.]